MVPYKDRLGLAVSLGMTTYEARAYMALLDLGEAKASEVAINSGVPRGRIYEILENLQSKGLATVSATTPRQYRPVPLSAFAERRKKELQATAEDMERAARALAAEAPHRARILPRATGEFLLYRRRGAVMAKLREMIDSAKQELLISCSEACAIRSQKVFTTSFEERARAGVEMRRAVNITAGNIDAVKALDPCLRTRHSILGNRYVTITLTDNDQVLVCHWSPDDENPFFGDDVAFWSNDPGIVESFRSIFLAAWERGTDAESRYREIETGEPPERTDFITGRQQVLEAVLASGRSARREAWASTLSSTVAAQYKALLPFLRESPSMDRRTRMLVGYDGGSLEPLREFARHGVEVRIAEPPTLGRFMVFDGKEALSFTYPRPFWVAESDSTATGAISDDLLVRTTVRGAVEALRNAFETEWEKSVPLDRFDPAEPANSQPLPAAHLPPE